ncbi:Superfamily I DNA or RNA helicase [Pilibacter termitis]|uniref:DNA 3'-5' helicase n=1 Tax=Pilibacter termitis TaxID=263852 RepID=A0A1T4PIW5_9ENTE|nr:ATP-dependent helicase [Pilibacter termitis]SJZ91136.1 Superfamily I DNA or RNA helicase [Pilibacter termitis]
MIEQQKKKELFLINESQQKFINSDENFIKLLAPAGSGKTESILQFCKRKIEKDKNQKFILFSFTKAAAGEIEERLNREEQFSEIKSKLCVMTLNSFGDSFIRKGFFKVYPKLIEENEKNRLLTNFCGDIVQKKKFEYIAELIHKKGGVAVNKQKKIFDLIENSKLLGFTDDMVEKKDKIEEHIRFLKEIGSEEFLSDFLVSVEELFRKSEKTTSKQELIANEEIENVTLTSLLKLLRFSKEIKERLFTNARYTFTDQLYLTFLYINTHWEKEDSNEKMTLIVDEFQDSSPLDVFMLNELKKHYNANIVLAGDDDQSIYQFRGAALGIILQPEKILNEEFTTYVLDVNYRSPKNIIEMSQQLINNNTFREKKEISAYVQENAKVEFLNVEDGLEDLLDRIKENHEKNEKVGIIARKKSHLVPLQVLLNHHKISFYSEDDLNIFIGGAFDDIIELLKIKMIYEQGKTEEALAYMESENYMTLIETIFKYKLKKKEKEVFLNHVGRRYDEVRTLEEMKKMIAKMPDSEKIKWGKNLIHHQASLARIMEEFFKTETVAELIQLLKKDFLSFEKAFGKDDMFHLEPPLEQLSLLAKSYRDDFYKFMVDLRKTKNSYDEKMNIGANIHLTTAFRTKGREYDHTYILSSTNGTWPIHHAKTPEQLETERRIFYVAITRVKNSMTFVFDDPREISPYLKEMNLEQEIGKTWEVKNESTGEKEDLGEYLEKIDVEVVEK